VILAPRSFYDDANGWDFTDEEAVFTTLSDFTMDNFSLDISQNIQVNAIGIDWSLRVFVILFYALLVSMLLKAKTSFHQNPSCPTNSSQSIQSNASAPIQINSSLPSPFPTQLSQTIAVPTRPTKPTNRTPCNSPAAQITTPLKRSSPKTPSAIDEGVSSGV